VVRRRALRPYMDVKAIRRWLVSPTSAVSYLRDTYRKAGVYTTFCDFRPLARPPFSPVGPDQLPVGVILLPTVATASPEIHAQIIAPSPKPGVYTTSPPGSNPRSEDPLATHSPNLGKTRLKLKLRKFG